MSPSIREPRILVFAYACAPGRGSEEGTGWEFTRIAARLGETWVIVRDEPTQVAAILAALPSLPERKHLHVIPVGVPRWLGRIGDFGRIPGRAYLPYAVWQVRARRLARRLHRRHHFDLTWHITWSNGWFGSLAPIPGIRFVIGPVGGGVGPPWRLVPTMGFAGILRELLRAAARGAGRYLNPVTRWNWARADVIMAQNHETIAWLPAGQRHKGRVVLGTVLSDLPAPRPRTAVHSPPRAVFAGRLQTWKGAHLAAQAIARLSEWRLIYCGVGPDEHRLRVLVERLGVADRVEFLGHVPRARFLEILRDEADVLLFPSFHDEGGWVVSEAIAIGVPVVCLDRGGPVAGGGLGVPAGWPSETVQRLADAVLLAAGTSPSGPVPSFELQLAAVQSALQGSDVSRLQKGGCDQ